MLVELLAECSLPAFFVGSFCVLRLPPTVQNAVPSVKDYSSPHPSQKQEVINDGWSLYGSEVNDANVKVT